MLQPDSKIIINGVESTELDVADRLVRAVIISLFTWRRANSDDIVEGQRMGWFGDAVVPPVVNDKIGSRLWLLARAKILPETFNRAREYANEALQWLLDDGVASRVDVIAERYGAEGMALTCTIYRADDRPLILRFDDAWEQIRGV